ncbi:MAG: hypothetical protein QOI06_220 [Nocardioidaceae bacterium]|nr:hypothetical protein [Nocardioidaceae bacterium]
MSLTLLTCGNVRLIECPRGDLNPHALIRALAPQASASTYSATRTWLLATTLRASQL